VPSGHFLRAYTRVASDALLRKAFLFLRETPGLRASDETVRPFLQPALRVLDARVSPLLNGDVEEEEEDDNKSGTECITQLTLRRLLSCAQLRCLRLSGNLKVSAIESTAAPCLHATLPQLKKLDLGGASLRAQQVRYQPLRTFHFIAHIRFPIFCS
jgi:hypothetical protein